MTDGTSLMMQHFPDLPQVSSGWMQSKALFKTEGTQINIGLGRNGDAMNKFNNNILEFQVVQ